MYRLLLWLGAALLLAACHADPTSTEPPGAAHPAAAPAARRPAATRPRTAHADSLLRLHRLHLALARVNDSVEVEEYRQGDLNADGRPDYLVLAQGKEPCNEGMGKSYCRALFIVLDEGAAGLRVAASSATLVGCSNCGGVGTGGPFQDLIIKGTYFSVEPEMGSCDKAYTTTTFRYNRARHDWLLHRIDIRGSSCRDTTNADGAEYHQTVRDFGLVTFARFQSEQ